MLEDNEPDSPKLGPRDISMKLFIIIYFCNL